jgi:CHAT domain-containing protein/tetratricopeptide (TPR) repeat protein
MLVKLSGSRLLSSLMDTPSQSLDMACSKYTTTAVGDELSKPTTRGLYQEFYKSRSMKADYRGQVLLAIILMTLLLAMEIPVNAAPPPQTPTATLRLINDSEQTICFVQISSVTDAGWGPNHLGNDDTIAPAQTYIFELEVGAYDVRLLDCKGNTLFEEYHLFISEIYDLHFAEYHLCDTLNQAGMSLYWQGRYPDAVEQFQQASSCYQEIGDRTGEGTALHIIGFIYDKLGRYEQALNYYKQSLVIRKELGDRAGEGTTLHNIGFTYSHLSQYEQALDYYLQSLTILQQIGGSRAEEGESLLNIGFIYGSLGQYEQALDYLQQSLAISQEIDDRVMEGATLHNIGAIYGSLGQHEQALDYLQQSLGVFQAIGDRIREVESLNKIGGIYASLGRYEQALDYYQQSLTIAQETGDRAEEGESLNNIGSIYGSLGQYEQALEHYQQCWAISQEMGDRAGEAAALNNIGGIYDSVGQYEQALEHYQQSLAISQEIGDRVGEGRSLNNIGGIYDSVGRYEQALDYYLQSLTIVQGIGDRAGEATALNNIGSIYGSLGQYEQALEYYQQSLAISQEIGDRIRVGRSLNNIGGIYGSLGQDEQALDYFQQSLMILQQIGDRAWEGITLNNIGGTYASMGQHEQALDYYWQAMETLEWVRARAGTEEGRAGFIARYAFLYRQSAGLFHRQQKDVEAFYTTERGRARAFLDSLATRQVYLSDYAAAQVLAQEQEAYAQRKAIQDALARARFLDPPDPELATDLEARLAEAEAAYQSVQEAIAARGAELAALVPGRGQDYLLSVSQVQGMLDKQTTLISYFLLEDKTLAFIITRDSFNTVSLEVTPEELVTQIRDFRDFADFTFPAYPTSVITLYGWLIEPLKEYLNTPHLAIVPHGVLHYLTFAALTDGQRYLIDDYVLTTLPSASALPFIQENARRSITSGQLPLILGNPTSGHYDATASFATERDGLRPLPFAEKEAQAIAALYSVEPLIGKDATEGAVRGRASGAGILHLAAHGFYNPVAPLSSLIALAPDEANDGWLTVGEVYGLDLSRADLVVLSACQTNLGELSAGDELVGLTRAFIFAGTPTVVASLWSVEDESTALLMERFYAHLRDGMGKAEALRQAQLEVREKYPNPYYWAGFVLSGDGGEMGDVEPTTIEEAGIEEVDATLAPAATPASEATPPPELVAEEQESQNIQETRFWRWPSLVGALLILLLLSSGAIIWRRAK